MITERLAEIYRRIAEAAVRSKRDPREITLVAVAKGQPVEKINEAIKAGQRDFGENYAQEMLAHAGAGLKPAPAWHFIGHLQRNKVRQIIDKVSLIHSVDSSALAAEIDRRAAAVTKVQPVLIEVNLGGEVSKTGIAAAEVEKLVGMMRQLDHTDLRGLMVIPPYDLDARKSRPFFRTLREIRDAINRKTLYKHPLTELSMGMTHDFEVAIEEGATIIRIGTGIFGERAKN